MCPDSSLNSSTFSRDISTTSPCCVDVNFDLSYCYLLLCLGEDSPSILFSTEEVLVPVEFIRGIHLTEHLQHLIL